MSSPQKISKITKHIYLGSCIHPLENTDEFEKLKIDVVINCASVDVVYLLTSEMKFLVENFPFENDQYATLLEHIDAAVKTMAKYLAAGKKIYLHCVTGNSQAPAILIYYLMLYKKFTYDRAFELVQAIRPGIDLNPNFERELRAIEDG